MGMERFSWKTEKLQHSDDEVIMVVDNANKEWKGHILNIVDKLNELNDERMMYKTTIDKRIVELEEENEQLQKTIKEVIELLLEEVDLFSDKATEHDIIPYKEMNEFDNKDAYYMCVSTKKAIKMLQRCL